MRRLSLQIYWTFVSILLLFTLLMMIAWWIFRPEQRLAPWLQDLGSVAGMLLPGTEAPPDKLQTLLDGVHSRIAIDVSVFDSSGRILAAAGNPLAPPTDLQAGSAILRGASRHEESVLALALPDGRWVMLRGADDQQNHRAGFLFLALLAVAVALGAYPLVRRLTHRLERLRHRVEALGAGDFAARVEVEGRDEIADLARSFNEAAGRIDRLVNAQRNTLAAASHELRSPLARIRVAVELLGQEGRPQIRDRIAADIAELDELIGELLLASRLDVAPEVGSSEEVDLLGLVAEEAARIPAEAVGEVVCVSGDRRLLRRAIRNLLENAKRYGDGRPIEVSVSRVDARHALIRVCDRGPGIPAGERERIFEPFYRRVGTREMGEGVGLGLSLVRQIASRHGGSVRVRDRDDGCEGSCFEIELPIA
jgi:signal transduction histidine kinase